MESYGNYLGLLRWSLKHSAPTEDGAATDTPTEMDPERRAFLEAALREATVDPNRELMAATAALRVDVEEAAVMQLPGRPVARGGSDAMEAVDGPTASSSAAAAADPSESSQAAATSAAAGDPVASEAPPAAQSEAAPAEAAATAAAAAAPEESLADVRVRSLQRILDFVDDIDLALNFTKMGGLSACVTLLTDTDLQVRQLAAEVIGTCTQNNHQVQDAFLSAPVAMARLLQGAAADSANEVRVKAMFAIASVIRGNDRATVAFVTGGGFSLLSECVKPECSSPLRRKALTLTRYLVTRSPAAHVRVGRMGITAAAVSAAESSDPSEMEAGVQLLAALNEAGCDLRAEFGQRLQALRTKLQASPEAEACEGELELLSVILSGAPSRAAAAPAAVAPAPAPAAGTTTASPAAGPVFLLK